jgi:predicted RNA-binding protein YlxR (DUF448 family)
MLRDNQKVMMKAKMRSSPIKHIPQRTCIACRQSSAKRELVRLIRVNDWSVEVDTTGKKSGRGAYLCPVQECWGRALKSGILEKALDTRIKPENKEILVNYAKGINNTSGIGRR